ncbi:MAG: acetyl-CoA carboxylase carboxyltransferase subunit beta [Planctomycetes bacterium]|nr:acetyl-CoA carboxylase carboxyltransferase subunit beta [Planctomycetota bacterium]
MVRFRFRPKKALPDGLWLKCEGCAETVYKKELDANQKVCPKCEYHFPMTAPERIASLLDPDSFAPWFESVRPADPLNFRALKGYAEQLAEAQARTGLSDAIVVGSGRIDGSSLAFSCTDSRFLMGSMGSAVGEKFTRLVERATKEGLPVVSVSGSGGGARMHESSLSLMQMVKVSAALRRHSARGGFFLSILTHPTMGGVLASFASLGDIVIAEPRALLGFTGPRVIRETIRQSLPEGFQSSEFMLDHGLVDKIVPRPHLRATVRQFLEYCAHAS